MRQWDIVIVGGGPAGLTAGIYAARAHLNVLLVEKTGVGGQVLKASLIENWPGIENISGFDLIDRMYNHAKRLNLKVQYHDITKITTDGDIKTLHSTDVTIQSKMVILAVGAHHRKLGIPGEIKYCMGGGVSYCGTCDGPFFRDMTVAVIGGGNTAVSDALYITKFAKKVYLIHRRDKLRATATLVDRV